MLKLKSGNPVVWEKTRAGWNYVAKIFSQFNDESGILFDGTLDESFGYNAAYKKEKGIIPYKEPWIGFIHSTIELCPCLKNEFLTLDQIILSDMFSASLEYCKGIFTLSDYLAEYIREKLGRSVSVESLKHPTEFPGIQFSLEKFLAEKKVVHAGVWLRRISSFYQLKAPGYRKILLLKPRLLSFLERELDFYKELNFDFKSTEIMRNLPDEEYDCLLGESVVFLHLCDCGASNTVIECIARATPLLVNRLEPLEEYLGKDYTFYYTTLNEAAQKLADINLIEKTADYLRNFHGREELTADHFINSFLNSEIIRSVL